MPARTASARSRRAASLPPGERRDMVVLAALPLMLERGDKVTTAEIAAAAGIAEGTIFRVFDTKEDLIDAVIDRVLDPAPVEAAIAALDPAAGLEETVTAAVKVLQRRVADAWQLVSNVGPHVHRRRRHRPDMHSPALTELMGRFSDDLAVPPAEAARVLRSVTLALSHPALTDLPMDPARIARHFLHGVAAPC